MTLGVTSRIAGPYACNGVVVAFDFNYKVFSESDVRVTHAAADGVETVLVINTNYTVALNADQANEPGGTITTVATYPVGVTITIDGAQAYSQTAEITNLGGFYPKIIERALDRLGISIQQLKRLIDRSLKFPVSDATLPVDLPVAAERAGKFFAFDANGQALMSAAQSGAPTSDFMATVLDDTTSNAALTTLTATRSETGATAVPVLTILGEAISIYRFMTAAQIADVQARTETLDVSGVFATVGATGKRIYLPDGTYRIDSVVEFTTSSPSFFGQSRAGVILKVGASFVEPAGKGLLTWSGASAVTVENLTVDGDTWSTSAYPDALLRFDLSDHIRVRNCDLINNPNMGIAGYGIDTFDFTDNYIEIATARNTDNDAISVVESGATKSYNGRVMRNECNKSGMLLNVDTCMVAHNRVKDWKFGSGITTGIYPKTANITLIGNKITGGTGVDTNALVSCGVELYGDNPIAIGNYISGCDGQGMVVGGRKGIIAHNVIVDNGNDPGATHFAGLLADYVDANVNANGTMFIGNISKGANQGYGFGHTGVAPFASGIFLLDNDFNGNMTGSENIAAGTNTRVVTPMLHGSAAWTPGLIATGAIAATAVGVTGARLGDYVMASFDQDLQNCSISGWVSANDVVSVAISNNSGAGKTIAAGTLRAAVMKRPGYANF